MQAAGLGLQNAQLVDYGGLTVADAVESVKAKQEGLRPQTIQKHKEGWVKFSAYLKLLRIVDDTWDQRCSLEVCCKFWQELIKQHDIAVEQGVDGRAGKKSAVHELRKLTAPWVKSQHAAMAAYFKLHNPLSGDLCQISVYNGVWKGAEARAKGKKGERAPGKDPSLNGVDDSFTKAQLDAMNRQLMDVIAAPTSRQELARAVVTKCFLNFFWVTAGRGDEADLLNICDFDKPVVLERLGPSKAPMFSTKVIDSKAGALVYRWLPHVQVDQCACFSLATYLHHRFVVMKEDFPDVVDGYETQWLLFKLFPKPGHPTQALTYDQKHRFMSELWKGNDVFISKVLHAMRKAAAIWLNRQQFFTKADIDEHVGWNKNVRDKHYLQGAPVGTVLALAGVDNCRDQHTMYWSERWSWELDEEQMEALVFVVFPPLTRLRQQVAGLTTSGKLQSRMSVHNGYHFLRDIYREAVLGAVIASKDWPGHPLVTDLASMPYFAQLQRKHQLLTAQQVRKLWDLLTGVRHPWVQASQGQGG